MVNQAMQLLTFSRMKPYSICFAVLAIFPADGKAPNPSWGLKAAEMVARVTENARHNGVTNAELRRNLMQPD